MSDDGPNVANPTMINLNNNPQPKATPAAITEKVFRNPRPRNRAKLASSAPSVAMVCVPGGQMMKLAEYKKYMGLTQAEQRVSRAPRGLVSEEGSLDPADLDGKDPVQMLTEYHDNLDSVTDEFFIFFRLLGLFTKKKRYTKTPGSPRSADEFLERYVKADDGAGSARKARMYIKAAAVYLEMTRAKVDPPNKVSQLLILAVAPKSQRAPILKAAMAETNGLRLGAALRRRVAAVRSSIGLDGPTKKPDHTREPAATTGNLDPTTVWKACEAETAGCSNEVKVRFFESLIHTFRGRVEAGLHPFRPVPRCLREGVGDGR